MKLFIAHILTFISLSISNLYAQEFNSSKEDFQRMVEYLANRSGKWKAPNPNYNSSNPKSSEALGLWFDKRLKGQVLHLSVVLYRNDTAHVISDAMWVWHPGEQRINYYDMNMRGRFQIGETYFNSDKEFVTRNYQYQPNGEITFARGVNEILSEGRHRTTSYLFENDEWRIQGSFEWVLTEENEGYTYINEQ